MRRATGLMLVIALVLVGSAPAVAGKGNSRNFTAHLAGRNEVPAVDTNATGQAIFHVAKDGQSIDYKLIVANIEDIIQSHIHIGQPGVNGPVTVFLFGPANPTVTTNGVLATGTITEDDLIGPLAEGTLADLIEAMSTGNAYVNVHTTANPGGEIRGPIG